MSNVSNVGNINFDSEVLQSAQPVLVDFTAEWCPPCKALSPIVDRIAGKFNGQLKVVKCDVDESPELAAQYGALRIPNLLFFKDAQVVDQFVVYINEAQLAAKVAQVLEL